MNNFELNEAALSLVESCTPYQLAKELILEREKSSIDCLTCDNLGKINDAWQESYCSNCMHQGLHQNLYVKKV